jgi:hypothetical protein
LNNVKRRGKKEKKKRSRRKNNEVKNRTHVTREMRNILGF